MIRWLVISVLAAAIAFVLGVILGRQDVEPAEHLGVVANRPHGGGWVDIVVDRDLREYPSPGRDVWLLP